MDSMVDRGHQMPDSQRSAGRRVKLTSICLGCLIFISVLHPFHVNLHASLHVTLHINLHVNSMLVLCQFQISFTSVSALSLEICASSPLENIYDFTYIYTVATQSTILTHLL